MVNTIFGAKKENMLLGNLLVLTPKMTLVFHGYQLFLLYCICSF